MQFSPLEDRDHPDRIASTCWRCKHSLRGLPGRFCPQCGAEREPPPPGPFSWVNDGPPQWAHRFLRLPGRCFHAAMLAGCAAGLLAVSIPGGLAPAAAVAVGSLALLALIWSVRVAALLITLTLIGFRRSPNGAFRRLMIAPALVAITAALAAANVPARIAFRFSRPAMERWAERVMRGDCSALRQRRIGLYPARDISFTEHGVWFRIPGSMPNGGSGFVYSPFGRPHDSRELRFRRFDGAWYEWSHDY